MRLVVRIGKLVFSAITVQECVKVRHYTMQRATLAAYHMEEKRPGETFDAYQCRWCGYYHIGHHRELV
jgi:rubrerythrin